MVSKAVSELFAAPGEMALYATGVTVALRPGPVKLTQAVLGKANPEAIEKAITRRLKRFFQGAKFTDRVERPPFDYDEICDLAPQMINETRQVENLAGFQTQFLANAYADQLGIAVGYIQREIPDKTPPMSVGGQRIRASDHDVAVFRRRYSILDAPLLVLDDLCAGWLMDDQVDALEQVFPVIYGVVQSLILPVMAEVQADRKSWRLPYDKDLQLSCLMQKPITSGHLHAELLRTWEEKRAEESGQGPDAPRSGPRKGIGDPSTQQERLEAR